MFPCRPLQTLPILDLGFRTLIDLNSSRAWTWKYTANDLASFVEIGTMCGVNDANIKLTDSLNWHFSYFGFTRAEEGRNNSVSSRTHCQPGHYTQAVPRKAHGWSASYCCILCPRFSVYFINENQATPDASYPPLPYKPTALNSGLVLFTASRSLQQSILVLRQNRYNAVVCRVLSSLLSGPKVYIQPFEFHSSRGLPLLFNSNWEL